MYLISKVFTKINKKTKKSDFSDEKSPIFLKIANVSLTFKLLYYITY